MTNKKIVWIVVSLFLFMNHAVFSWNNHAVMTQEVLQELLKSDPEFSSYLNQSISTESLEHFLKTTQTTLPKKLNEIEKLLRDNEIGYQPLPETLFYDPTQTNCKNDLTVCFKKSLRINLNVPWNIIIFDPDKRYLKNNSDAKPVTRASQIMLDGINKSSNLLYKKFTLLSESTNVKIADVISSSAIQPDFGFDMYLYTDSNTTFGKLYNFGTQPAGGSSSTFASQILFHMSTYQDSSLLLNFLPRLKEDYPEYRAILYFNLSRFAAENNHPYWSAVFLGWGLHYIQDITQPYHAVLTNGLSNQQIQDAIDKIKKGDFKTLQIIIALQTNRHLSLENVTDYIMSSHQTPIDYHSILTMRLNNDLFDDRLVKCDVSPNYIRQHVNKRIAAGSAEYENILRKTLPQSFVDDPTFDVSQYENYSDLFYNQMNVYQRFYFTESISEALIWFGAYTRNCIKQYKVN